ncbi:DUF2079 domain-containing protein [Cellulomonas sp. Sa3CUA2]|uniref:DUF2079 domain-containing protein n=1 Tax=Cellulomonas avistercoris TaxID=2762242 RepID=A0ABR8QBI1_9CELL|nr:DUF2079 domain-containing protein [Cellulomonas avistercoris]MBD7917775.1 DUF2079 domain-containing protein [Cellulomonas avistercoris]
MTSREPVLPAERTEHDVAAGDGASEEAAAPSDVTEEQDVTAADDAARPQDETAADEHPRPTWRERGRHVARVWALPAAVGLLVATLYTVYSVAQWRAFVVRSWDLGIFTQLASRYAGLEAPIVHIKGPDYHLLGDHFHPLLVLLGPVYAVFPHALTLLVLQNVLFGLAAAVVTRAAVPLLGRVVGGLVGVAFGLSWGLQYAVEAQFHEIAFAVPLLAIALVAVLREQWRTAVVAGALLALVKEDLGLTTAVLGVVIAWRARRPALLWLSAWGVAGFVLATRVVLPRLNPEGEWAYGSRLDLAAALSDPLALYAPAKGYTLWLLVVVTGAIALRSPFVLLALPTLAWRFLSAEPGYWEPTWHYSAVLLPIAFVAMLDGIDRARRGRVRWLRRYSRYAPVVGLTASLMLLPQLPLWQLTNPGLHFGAPRAQAARDTLAVIPDDVVVETDVGLMSYLVDRTDVYYLGNRNPVPDYLLIDRQGGGTPQEWGDVLQVAALLHPGVPFEVVHVQDGYEVARHVADG